MTGNHIYSGYPKVTADLASEPVSLPDFKLYAHITYSDDDAQLTAIVKSARMILEAYTGKSFGVKTIDIVFGTSGNGINLPRGPVNEITALEYRSGSCCGYIPAWESILNNTDDWLLTGNRFLGCEGEYKATYTTTGIATEDVLTAIKAQALFLWENRGDSTKQGKISPIAAGLVSSIMNIA